VWGGGGQAREANEDGGAAGERCDEQPLGWLGRERRWHGAPYRLASEVPWFQEGACTAACVGACVCVCVCWFL
jgi:hypothetical protein